MCVGACSRLLDLSESVSRELGAYKINGSSPGSVVWPEGSDVPETGSECSSDVPFKPLHRNLSMVRHILVLRHYGHRH